MYYIYDHVKKSTQVFADQEAVIGWWCAIDPRGRIDELNVTGRDVKMAYMQVGTQRVLRITGYETIPEYQNRPVLRRYQVFDENHRSIDVRLWDRDKWGCTAQPAANIGIHSSGYKQHFHNGSGPSMWHRTLRDRVAATCDELMETDMPRPILDKTAPRIGCAFPSTYAVWEFYEDKARARAHSSKSWKDQTRARKQWGKHKAGTRQPYNKESEYDPGLFCRLRDEGLPVLLENASFVPKACGCEEGDTKADVA